MSRSTSPRMRRVNSILLEAVAEEVAGLKDPRIGFVTITAVDTSPDLRRAIVYYSVLGTAEECSSTGEALASAASYVRTGIGHKVRLKYTPKLEFRIDESIERGTQMWSLLRDLADRPAGTQGEPDDV